MSQEPGPAVVPALSGLAGLLGGIERGTAATRAGRAQGAQAEAFGLTTAINALMRHQQLQASLERDRIRAAADQYKDDAEKLRSKFDINQSVRDEQTTLQKLIDAQEDIIGSPDLRVTPDMKEGARIERDSYLRRLSLLSQVSPRASRIQDEVLGLKSNDDLREIFRVSSQYLDLGARGALRSQEKRQFFEDNITKNKTLTPKGKEALAKLLELDTIRGLVTVHDPLGMGDLRRMEGNLQVPTAAPATPTPVIVQAPDLARQAAALIKSQKISNPADALQAVQSLARQAGLSALPTGNFSGRFQGQERSSSQGRIREQIEPVLRAAVMQSIQGSGRNFGPNLQGEIDRETSRLADEVLNGGPLTPPAAPTAGSVPLAGPEVSALPAAGLRAPGLLGGIQSAVGLAATGGLPASEQAALRQPELPPEPGPGPTLDLRVAQSPVVRRAVDFLTAGQFMEAPERELMAEMLSNFDEEDLARFS